MTAKRTREPETAPAPDPVIELAERWQREMTLWLEKTGTSATAIEADADSLKALEDELEAATPTTRECQTHQGRFVVYLFQLIQ